MKVVLYARVSTTRQAERDLSIPDQIRQMKEYCKNHGHKIVREYVEEGASATDANRPVFREMVEDLFESKSGVEAILVLTTSRFFRDALGARIYKRKLKKNGIKVISITQEVSDDPTGTFVEGIFELQDQYESDINGFHTLRGMKENSRRGFFNGSTPPFGYRIEKVQDERGNEKSKLVIDDAEAEVVRRMFDLYMNGKDGREIGIKRVAELLNQEQKFFRDDKKWTNQKVCDRLSDPVYKGNYYFNKRCGKTGQVNPKEEWVKVDVEPIVESEFFDQATKLRKRRNPIVQHPSRVRSPNLLTGLMVCGACGSKVGVESAKGGKYRYYNCLGYLQQGRSTCKGNRVPKEDLENQILEYLSTKLFSKERVKLILKELVEEISKVRRKNDSRFLEVKNRLASTQEKISRHYEAIESGVLELDLVADRLKDLKEWESQLQEQLERLSKPRQLPPYLFKDENLAKVQEGLTSIFMSQNHTLTKRYLRFLLEKIEIKGTEVKLYGNKTSLLNFALSRKTRGTVNQLETVPSCVLSWLPKPYANREPSG